MIVCGYVPYSSAVSMLKEGPYLSWPEQSVAEYCYVHQQLLDLLHSPPGIPHIVYCLLYMQQAAV